MSVMDFNVLKVFLTASNIQFVSLSLQAGQVKLFQITVTLGKAFLDLIQGHVPEPFPDGYITGEELGYYLKHKVPEYNEGQHPTVW